MMGKVIMSGIVPPLVAPVAGILAGDLAVGSSVYLMENGVAVEYLVVNQGIPSGSSLYDASCDGTWLLRKDIYEKRQWHSSNVNNYEASTIHNYLNGTFFNLFGSIEQTAIKQVKIPCVGGTGGSSVVSGANGLNTKIFLLSAIEVGFSNSSVMAVDGAKIDYFEAGISASSANNKRIAYFSGSATSWWIRSPDKRASTKVHWVNTNGVNQSGDSLATQYGIRPSIIVPFTAVFDETTMLLKGVK